jgi:hypothetical protein
VTLAILFASIPARELGLETRIADFASHFASARDAKLRSSGRDNTPLPNLVT